MDFWHSVNGMMEVELTSAELEGAFAAISSERIEIWRVKKISELTCSFWVSRQSYKMLEHICEKRGEILKIRRKQGLFWKIRYASSRPVLLVGGALLLAMALWLPTRVFFVCVEGNINIPDKMILEAAEGCGIVFGASRREVRSEKVKNALLSAVPELQWAGVNTSGCTATISVRERSDPEDPAEETAVSSIVASRDGYVLSCTVTRGNALVKSGVAVKEGQTLISAYTDCGLCIRAERAEGEVYAQTNRTLKVVMPDSYAKKGTETAVKRKISLLLRKKRIFLWKDSGIWDTSCGRMYEEYYVTLPGGFRLPFALCVEEYICCESYDMEVSEQEAKTELQSFANSYLFQNMIAGRIISTEHTVYPENGVYRLEGRYTCVEMIGRVRQEQIGDTNGENS